MKFCIIFSNSGSFNVKVENSSMLKTDVYLSRMSKQNILKILIVDILFVSVLRIFFFAKQFIQVLRKCFPVQIHLFYLLFYYVRKYVQVSILYFHFISIWLIRSLNC